MFLFSLCFFSFFIKLSSIKVIYKPSNIFTYFWIFVYNFFIISFRELSSLRNSWKIYSCYVFFNNVLFKNYFKNILSVLLLSWSWISFILVSYFTYSRSSHITSILVTSSSFSFRSCLKYVKIRDSTNHITVTKITVTIHVINIQSIFTFYKVFFHINSIQLTYYSLLYA
jgi:hypothetical protein